LVFAFLSNFLVRRQFERTFEGFAREIKQPPETPPPMPLPYGTEAKQKRLNLVNISYLFTGLLGAALAFLLSYYLSNRISKPLSELSAATRGIAGGRYGKRVEVQGGREVEELGEAFNELSESLERNERLRRNMVVDISHELRNPLAVQRGHLEALQDGVIELDKNVLDVLMENNNLLTRLVEDLRQLSLVDAGKIELDLMPVDMGEAARVVASSFERELSEKGVSLNLEIAPGLPRVKADQGRVSQILGNLLRNSLMYTPRGGSITIAAEEKGGMVMTSVRDTGPGMDKEELPYVFERFYRTDKSRTRDTGGTGLGLSIAKGLVEAQGGSIWAESEAGEGAAFHFTLPLFQGESA
jgi:signal transduction histidine kinase